jgi:hypothetical protein
MEKRKVLRLRSIDKEAEKAKRRKTLHSAILKLLKVGVFAVLSAVLGFRDIFVWIWIRNFKDVKKKFS